MKEDNEEEAEAQQRPSEGGMEDDEEVEDAEKEEDEEEEIGVEDYGDATTKHERPLKRVKVKVSISSFFLLQDTLHLSFFFLRQGLIPITA